MLKTAVLIFNESETKADKTQTMQALRLLILSEYRYNKCLIV